MRGFLLFLLGLGHVLGTVLDRPIDFNDSAKSPKMSNWQSCGGRRNDLPLLQFDIIWYIKLCLLVEVQSKLQIIPVRESVRTQQY